jgi:hypothetical protein
VNIRTYQPGDETAQVAIFNEVAADLPKFKPATVEEVRRRHKDRDFDAGTHFYAEEGGRVVGYVVYHANGRVGYPWCARGYESLAEPLFQHVLQAMRQRGLTAAFAAYRGDWPVQTQFFLSHGFRKARDMINFVLDLPDMPTPAARPSIPVSPLRREDLRVIRDLAPNVLRVSSQADLEKHFFSNPYFKPESLFVLRGRVEMLPVAVGILIADPTYADPKAVDPNAPCFRLGAFGTEGMTAKRINGLFSFLAAADRDMNRLAMDLMGYAASRLEESDAGALAAQVASDAPHLLRFYQQHFRRQGSFPVFERSLTDVAPLQR